MEDARKDRNATPQRKPGMRWEDLIRLEKGRIRPPAMSTPPCEKVPPVSEDASLPGASGSDGQAPQRTYTEPEGPTQLQKALSGIKLSTEMTRLRGPKRKFSGKEPVLSDEQLEYLRAYTFAPAVGLYWLNRAGWPLLLAVPVGLVPVAMAGVPAWAVAAAVAAFLICPPLIGVVCLHAGFLMLNRPWELSPFALSGDAAGYGVMALGWVALGYSAWLGYRGRGIRFRGLSWRDFDAFRREEELWSLLGGIVWLLIATAVAGTLILRGLDRFAEWLKAFLYL